MIPYRNQKLGTKKIIPCPNCDGTGVIINVESDDYSLGIGNQCPDCKGTGKIEGIISSQ